MENKYDVIVIGAGAAGLMAALELAMAGRKVIIIEAKDKVGGRINTITDNQFQLPVELGAEFVHGKLHLTQLLLKKAGAMTSKVEGSIWRKENGKLKSSDFIEDYSELNKKFKELQHDIPVAQFFAEYLNEERFEDLRASLKSYVEGYYAAYTDKASTFALKGELENSEDVQYRVEGGYKKLLEYFEQELAEKNCAIALSQPVKQINWQRKHVEVITASEKFIGQKILVTVSIGVLQSEEIILSPPLPQKIAAAKSLGYGPVIKSILQFEKAFWKEKALTQEKNLHDLSFIFSDEAVPTWWTYYPKDTAMITGWLGGPNALKFADLSDEEILNRGLYSLGRIFNHDILQLKQLLIKFHITNWVSDPYSCGGYSYDVVDGKKQKDILKQPVHNTLFFAGEGLHEGSEIGTVEAALANGREAAHKMIADIN